MSKFFDITDTLLTDTFTRILLLRALSSRSNKSNTLDTTVLHMYSNHKHKFPFHVSFRAIFGSNFVFEL